MGDASALKLAAFGWTIAVLAVSWAIVERRGRKRAEMAKTDRDRESDAAHHARVAGLHEVRNALTAIINVIDQQSKDD